MTDGVTDKITFKVLAFPNGHLLVSTTRSLRRDEYEIILEQLKGWRDKENGIALMAETEVQLAEIEYTPVEITLSAPRDEEVPE